MSITIKNEYISSLVKKVESELIKTRRHLHQHPELSFQEHNTHNFICSYLDKLNVKYEKNVIGTGVVAYIDGEKLSDNSSKKETILFRADIDALPITEKSNSPYKSQNDGVMHACGHDAHTAIMLGVCNVLSKITSEFSGCVKVIFQPGEETSGGAEPMINTGVLKNPDVSKCFALHVDPDIDAGRVRVKPNSLYASPDDFKITVNGKGGHGAEPHNCIDPINISAHIITSLMTLAGREVNPFSEAVVSIGSINSGTATNIIPDKAVICGTARSLTNDIRSFLKRRIGEVADFVCKSFGATCDYEYTELFPPLINDEELAEKVFDIALNTLGENNCIYGGEATMAGEDFAYFTQEVPSVLFKLGCKNSNTDSAYPLHHSEFDIDEDCLSVGVAMFVAIALDLLN